MRQIQKGNFSAPIWLKSSTGLFIIITKNRCSLS